MAPLCEIVTIDFAEARERQSAPAVAAPSAMSARPAEQLVLL
ncbi:hypothetical protein [Xanthobacter sediminis]